MEFNSFEVVQTCNVRPLPIVQNSSSIDKDVGHQQAFSGRLIDRSDGDGPFSRPLVPFGAVDFRIERDERIQVIFLGHGDEVIIDFLGRRKACQIVSRIPTGLGNCGPTGSTIQCSKQMYTGMHELPHRRLRLGIYFLSMFLPRRRFSRRFEM